jgi:hypothetical protein
MEQALPNGAVTLESLESQLVVTNLARPFRTLIDLKHVPALN